MKFFCKQVAPQLFFWTPLVGLVSNNTLAYSTAMSLNLVLCTLWIFACGCILFLEEAPLYTLFVLKVIGIIALFAVVAPLLFVVYGLLFVTGFGPGIGLALGFWYLLSLPSLFFIVTVSFLSAGYAIVSASNVAMA
jgi:hypothetical protein